MGNSNSKDLSTGSMKVYQDLINMGFGETMSINAVKKYKDNLNKCIDYINLQSQKSIDDNYKQQIKLNNKTQQALQKGIDNLEIKTKKYAEEYKYNNNDNEKNIKKTITTKSFYNNRYKEIEREQNILVSIEENQTFQNKKEHEFKLNELNMKSLNDMNGYGIEQIENYLNYLNELRKLNTKSTDDIMLAINKNKLLCDTMKKDIENEEKNLEKYSEEMYDSNIYKIVLLGPTGHGKSTFGNRLCGDFSIECDKGLFPISDKVDSETEKISKISIKNLKQYYNDFDYKLSVFDTPGNFDSFGKDREHANNLIEFLRGCRGINAFVIIKTIKTPRFDSKFKQYLNLLTTMLGKDFWKYVIFILTHTPYSKINTNEYINYCDQFNQQIKNDLNLDDVNIPIIGIDNYDDMENYKKQIYELLNIIKPIPYQCKALKSPLDEYKIKYQSYLFELNNLYELLNKYNIQQNELNEKNYQHTQLLVSQHKKTISDLQNNVTEKDKYIQNEHKRIDILKNNIDTLKLENKYKNAKTNNYDSQFLLLKNDIDIQRIQLNTSQNRITSYMSDINNLNDDINEVRSENTQKISQITSQRQTILELQKEIRTKENQLDSKQDRISILTERDDDNDDTIRSLRNKISTLDRKVDKLNDEIRDKNSSDSNNVEEAVSYIRDLCKEKKNKQWFILGRKKNYYYQYSIYGEVHKSVVIIGDYHIDVFECSDSGTAADCYDDDCETCFDRYDDYEDCAEARTKCREFMDISNKGVHVIVLPQTGTGWKSASWTTKKRTHDGDKQYIMMFT